MVVYFYGDNVFTSRKQLSLLLDQFSSQNPNNKIVTIEKNDFDPVAMRARIRNVPLFNEEKLYLIEQPRKFNLSQQKQLFKILSEIKGTVVFWDNQETNLASKLKKYFPKLKTFRFPQPKIIFKFLGAVYPNNQKVFLPLFQQLIKQQPFGLVFYFLKKHCHNLILASDKNSLFSGWQQQKLNSQLQKFSLEKLIFFYRELINLEYKEKTGRLGISLDLALVNLMASL